MFLPFRADWKQTSNGSLFHLPWDGSGVALGKKYWTIHSTKWPKQQSKTPALSTFSKTPGTLPPTTSEPAVGKCKIKKYPLQNDKQHHPTSFGPWPVYKVGEHFTPWWSGFCRANRGGLLHLNLHHATCTPKPFTPNTFCTKRCLAPGNLYTRHVLHQTPFAPNTFYTYTIHLLHKSTFYTRQLVHQTSSNNYCTIEIAHRKPFSKQLLHQTPTFYTKHFLRQTVVKPDTFYTQRLLHTPNVFYTKLAAGGGGGGGGGVVLVFLYSGVVFAWKQLWRVLVTEGPNQTLS